MTTPTTHPSHSTTEQPSAAESSIGIDSAVLRGPKSVPLRIEVV